MRLYDRYRAAVAAGELKPDPAQDRAVVRLQELSCELVRYRPRRWFIRQQPPRGLYLWGDVGRGKSMLMDLFFETAPTKAKRRVHFNAFMVEAHARIHEWRNLDARARGKRREYVRDAGDDPIPPVARGLVNGDILLCFDEFQVTDVADAMILGRLFEQLFAMGVVIVATSNTAPKNLYEGGLNRQLFLPFIALIEKKLDVLELHGDKDYRRLRLAGLNIYITPLGAAADAAMDAAWQRLTDQPSGESATLKVLGRTLRIPHAAKGVARFDFADLCSKPLAAADYLAIAQHYHTILIDRIPVMDSARHHEARRFTLLIDTLYDEGAKLICSAAAPPEELYTDGYNAEAFRRAASRLVEMQSEEYLKRGHGIHLGDEAAFRPPAPH
ncbi:MAG TPA: cell division protein ZapE [Rhizomicrobium sp.]|jgi:cell division protein ZapE|nr:cell division protein ZapE [Rhizomicrobium sp.]